MTCNSSKYSLVEWELKFLLPHKPDIPVGTVSKIITDRYLIQTGLRLRNITSDEGAIYKLTKKLPFAPGESNITTIYLSEGEYNLFCDIPAILVVKTRYVIKTVDAVIGIDHYVNADRQLWLAEN